MIDPDTIKMLLDIPRRFLMIIFGNIRYISLEAEPMLYFSLFITFVFVGLVITVVSFVLGLIFLAKIEGMKQKEIVVKQE